MRSVSARRAPRKAAGRTIVVKATPTASENHSPTLVTNQGSVDSTDSAESVGAAAVGAVLAAVEAAAPPSGPENIDRSTGTTWSRRMRAHTASWRLWCLRANQPAKTTATMP